jgi:glycosyltransferase involved in cell wall biosynthesis
LRIAVVNSFGQIVGGVERYLDSSIPLLVERGHEVHLWHEREKFAAWRTRPSIRTTSTVLPVESLRFTSPHTDSIVASITDWSPDVVCVHSSVYPALEKQLLEIAPSVYFAHAFSGTCISGKKTLNLPTPHPCERVLGPKCLLHYLPDHCGDLNPVKGLRDYARNVEQLENIRQYSAIVAFSSYIGAEYERHGVSAKKIGILPPFAPSDAERARAAQNQRSFDDAVTIGYAGRLVAEKGTKFLLDALPLAQVALNKPIKAVIAGDGREWRKLERQAARIVNRYSAIEIVFTKWAGRRELDEFYGSLDLLVVPSVWPEPFGMVGLEAGARGLPVAAFAVGGITDWLRDGVNGHLAPGDIPTVEGLSDAIVRCLRDRSHYESLCAGAIEVEAEYSESRHVCSLTGILQSVQLQHA